MDDEVFALQERAKELACLYQVQGILTQPDLSPKQVFQKLVSVLPAGWQRSDSCGVLLEYLGQQYQGENFSSQAPYLTQSFYLGGLEVGALTVSDLAAPPDAVVFLDEEQKLLENVARRLQEYLEWKHLELLGGRKNPKALQHWRWRQNYAEAMAAQLDGVRFGVSRLYLGGSTEDGSASHGSDIDLYIIFNGGAQQKKELVAWLEGWSLCLAEMAHQQTGLTFPDGLFNLHWLLGPPGAHLAVRNLPLKTHS